MPTSIYDPENRLRATLKIIDELGYDGSKVVFEVIETGRLDNVAHLTYVLGYYRRNGIKLAKDDLSGGYSALSLLREVEPDFIKIDRALISDSHKSQTQTVIRQRIIDLCQEPDTRLVAKGIKAANEEAVFLGLNVDLLQGCYCCKRQAHPPGWIAKDTRNNSEFQVDPAVAQTLKTADSTSTAKPQNLSR